MAAGAGLEEAAADEFDHVGPRGGRGLRPGLAGHETLAGAAARVTIPVQFLLQWDDEQIPRESGLALFDAFASREKSLHANPGRHADVPMFEVESSLRFFGRHLSPGGFPGGGG